MKDTAASLHHQQVLAGRQEDCHHASGRGEERDIIVRGHGDQAGDIMITGLYIFYNVYMYPEVVNEMFGLVMCEELA